MSARQQTCQACEHEEGGRRLSRKAWLATGAALVVAGIFVPFAGVLFLLLGVGLVVATPFLPELYRCGGCGRVNRGTGGVAT